MNRKTILSCAVTGNIVTRDQHPGLPVTPLEIATAAIDAARAGAAIVHIHVRDPDTGAPSMDLARYSEVFDRIRSSGVDVIINLTTGPGGRYVPGNPDPAVAGPGTNLLPAERRVEHVIALKPEICSLDLNTMWSGSSAVINAPDSVRAMAKAIRDAGVKPELEVFDSGDIHLANALIGEGILDKFSLFQIVTGVRYGFASTPTTLSYAASLLPHGSPWGAFGIGRMAYPMLAQAFLLGGNVRIGMEDCIFLSRGVLAPDNAALCRKAVEIIAAIGGSFATGDEARCILGLH